MKNCGVCGKPFKPVTNSNLYCSKECAKIAHKRRNRESKKRQHDAACKDLVCPMCLKPFHQTSLRQVYCSDECRREANNKRDYQSAHTSTCPICGKRYKKKVSNQKYCSETCKIKAKRKVPETRVCPVCGDKFVGAYNQRVCSAECRRILDTANRNGLSYAEARIRIARTDEKRRKPLSDLSKVARAAREAGMTYGQYVAKVEAPAKERNRQDKIRVKIAKLEKELH